MDDITNIIDEIALEQTIFDELAKKPIQDQKDGSNRLISYMGTCVNRGLSEDRAVRVCRDLLEMHPTARSFDDADLEARYSDALKKKKKRTQELVPDTDDLFDLKNDSGQTDLANAKGFVDANAGRIMFVPPWKSWIGYDGSRWTVDHGVLASQLANDYARSLWAGLADFVGDVSEKQANAAIRHVKQSCSAKKIAAFMQLAETDPRVVCQVDGLNQHDYYLNVRNGTIDLRTGELRPHDPEDRITQLANVEFNRNAKCPQWDEAMSLIFGHDAELVRYVRQLLGYSCSGEVSEHILPIGYGSGCNGKSFLWNTLYLILGDYAHLASERLLLGESSDHPTIIASLYQRRFVPISEPEKSSRLRQARVKELTGDRFITARRCKENEWTFKRTHTFWMSTNHLPRIDGTDQGICRRVKLIPFDVDLRKVTTPKKDLDQWMFDHEASGILNWLIAGYQDWKRNGFIEPAKVIAATKGYLEGADPIGEFLRECCLVDETAEVSAEQLYSAYQKFAGHNCWTQTAFGRELKTRFEKVRAQSGPYRNKMVYRGLCVSMGKESPEDEFAENPEYL